MQKQRSPSNALYSFPIEPRKQLYKQAKHESGLQECIVVKFKRIRFQFLKIFRMNDFRTFFHVMIMSPTGYCHLQANYVTYIYKIEISMQMELEESTKVSA